MDQTPPAVGEPEFSEERCRCALTKPWQTRPIPSSPTAAGFDSKHGSGLYVVCQRELTRCLSELLASSEVSLFFE